MSNVIPLFPYRDGEPPQKSYSIHIYWTGDETFDYVLDAGAPDDIDEDRVASDLAALALSLRPPPRTFLERLRALFLGDDQ
jgi:hypothetical protein